jgi:hypothetical protein
MVLAFLIPFGELSSCSSARIRLFLVLLVLSSILILVGTVTGAISYRKAKNRPALFSLLFTVIYAALAFYLLRLIS